MDPEEHDDEREYDRADYEADQADILLKEMKIDGSYGRWKASGLSYAEWQRFEREAEYERDRRLFAAGDEAARAAREREQAEITEAYERGKRDA